jgi:hypothetical protein
VAGWIVIGLLSVGNPRLLIKHRRTLKPVNQRSRSVDLPSSVTHLPPQSNRNQNALQVNEASRSSKTIQRTSHHPHNHRLLPSTLRSRLYLSKTRMTKTGLHPRLMSNSQRECAAKSVPTGRARSRSWMSNMCKGKLRPSSSTWTRPQERSYARRRLPSLHQHERSHG